jgi:hypothetical protein
MMVNQHLKGEIMEVSFISKALALLIVVFVFYLLFADVVVGIAKELRKVVNGVNKIYSEYEREQKQKTISDSDQNPDSN